MRFSFGSWCLVVLEASGREASRNLQINEGRSWVVHFIFFKEKTFKIYINASSNVVLLLVFRVYIFWLDGCASKERQKKRIHTSTTKTHSLTDYSYLKISTRGFFMCQSKTNWTEPIYENGAYSILKRTRICGFMKH